jgi:membrane protein YqaA with SNARE-associated domain
MSLYRSIAGGGLAWSHFNPMAVMTVIGATVGALVGPLIGAIAYRRRAVRAVRDQTNGGST